MKKLIIILSVLLLTGCYDYREINDLELISSIFVDYDENEYKVNLEVINTKEDASEGSYFIEGSGCNIEEALNNTYFDSKTQPYFSHLNVLVLTDKVVEQGIDKLYDYFIRDIDIRKDFLVLMCDDVDEFLDFKVEQGESIGLSLYDTAKKTKERNGRFRTSNFREVVYHYLRDNNYYIGKVAIEDEKLTVMDSYLFKDNELSLKVDEPAVLVSNMYYGDNKSFLIEADNSFEIYEYGLDRKFTKDKVTFKLSGKVKLLNMSETKSRTDEDIKRIEDKLNETMKKLIIDTIEYSRNRDNDILNLNYSYGLHNPKTVKSDSWKTIDYEVEVKLNINEKGMLLDTIGGQR